jgi:ribose transport system permease protein
LILHPDGLGGKHPNPGGKTMVSGSNDLESKDAHSPGTISTGNPKAYLWIDFFKSSREFLLLVIILILFIAMSLTIPNFFTTTNILSIFHGISLSTIVVIGATVVMVAGMVDLSVGSVLGCTGFAVAITLRAGTPIPIAILIGFLTAMCWGSVTGLLVSKVKVNFLIASLSTMFMARGVVYILSHGRIISGQPDSFVRFGEASFLGISSLTWVALACIPIADFVLHQFVSVRQLYRVGGDEETARLAGINVTRIKWSAFLTSGALSGMAGILAVSRFGAAQALMGTGEELQAITACVIGGCTLRGGKGSAFGSFLGLLLLALIKDAMVLMHVSVYYQRFISGALLAIVVSIDVLTHKEHKQ